MKIGELELNRIYNMDCLEGMKLLPDKSVDLVLADPDYNAKDIGPKHRKYRNQKMGIPIKEYKKFCKQWLVEAKRISDRIVLTPGIANTHNYPQPYWQLCWHKPAAVSFNRMGGYNAWEPIFIYGGTKNRIGQDYILCNTLNFKKGLESKHPCPKPLELWQKLVLYFSQEGETVLDPFMGSGTTAIACIRTGRNFIGFEIDKHYCDIANRRIKEELAQTDLFQEKGVYK